MKTTIARLDTAIKNILDDYADDVRDGVLEATKEAAKVGAKAVNANAQSTFYGRKYGRSWTSKVVPGRMLTHGVIYSRIPGLPHLLEHGHAKRGGGRVAGRPHIAPIEKQLAEEYAKAVKQKVHGST